MSELMGAPVYCISATHADVEVWLPERVYLGTDRVAAIDYVAEWARLAIPDPHPSVTVERWPNILEQYRREFGWA